MENIEECRDETSVMLIIREGRLKCVPGDTKNVKIILFYTGAIVGTRILHSDRT